MQEIRIFAPGSVVKVVGMLNLNATVIQVCIGSGRLQYQVAYWSDDTRRELWLEEFEVTDTDDAETPSKHGTLILTQ